MNRGTGPGLALLTAWLLACGPGAAPHPPDLPDPLIDPGVALLEGGQVDSARAFFQRSLAQPEILGTRTHGRLLTLLGQIARRKGEYPEARRLLERSIVIKEADGFEDDLPQSFNLLGLVVWDEGRYVEAASHFHRALDGFRAQRDRSGITRVSNNLGLVSFGLGRFDEARELFQTARDSARALGETLFEGRATINLAMWEIWAGDPQEALVLLSEARGPIAESADDHGLANALGQTAVAYRVLGEPGLALAHLDSAITIARREEMPFELTENLVILADLYAEAGEVTQALQHYAEAHRLATEMGLAVEAGNVLRGQGMARAKAGLFEQARTDLLEAVTVHEAAGAQREMLHDLVELAEAERRSGLPEVRATLGRARALAATLGSAQARVAVALVEGRVDIDARRDRSALALVAGIEPLLARAGATAEAEAAAIRMMAYLALGLPDSAVVAGRRSIEAFERIRGSFASGPLRSAYAADRSLVYANLVLLLLRLDEEAEAFQVADAARGRAIVEHLGAAQGAVRRGVGVADLAEADRLLRRIEHLLAQLAREEAVPPDERSEAHLAASEEILAEVAALQAAHRALMDGSAARDPARAAMLGIRPANLGEVQSALAPGEALLEYYVSPELLVTFVVRPDTMVVFSQPVQRTQLTELVRQASDRMQATERHDLERPVVEELYRLLILPAHDRGLMAGVSALVIVPHDALALLPFGALRNPATGRLLLEEAPWHFATTAAELPLTRARANVLGAGKGGSGFAPFPAQLLASAPEVRAFRAGVRGGRELVGRRATEAQVRGALERGGVVHLATHAVLDRNNPLFSRIELTAGRGGVADNGRLEVHEVLELTVNSPLVFLSGCETGLGARHRAGEDYTTLAQAFLAAGAANVVATLWRISDAGAEAFAARFYQHLRTQPPSQALARAQADLRADPRWRHPYYWAAYTLTGAGTGVGAQIGVAVAVQ